MGWKRILGLMGMYPLPGTDRRRREARAEEHLRKDWSEAWEHLPEAPPLVPAHQQLTGFERYKDCTCLIYQGRRSVNVACPIHGGTIPGSCSFD